jgi:hypothetical protein
MSRDKQIEEMAKVYEEARCKANETLGSMNEGADNWYAKAFYNAGYRKSQDVAEEIFAEIEKCFFEELVGCTEAKLIDEEMFAELKKKYTENKGE